MKHRHFGMWEGLKAKPWMPLYCLFFSRHDFLVILWHASGRCKCWEWGGDEKK